MPARRFRSCIGLRAITHTLNILMISMVALRGGQRVLAFGTRDRATEVNEPQPAGGAG